MQIAERRYDIDWIRVIAIGLLLIYHIAIGFQPWGIFIGFIQNPDSLESVWVPMSMLNVWRIPLLFFVSGMGVCFAIRRRNWKMLIRERTLRILVPFAFGVTVIVPLHVFLWQDFYDQDLGYIWHPYHLWFLGNIFIYVLLLSPVFFYLKKQQGKRVQALLSKVFSHPLGLLLAIVPFVLEAILVDPASFETYAMTWHGFYLGLLAFLFGFVFVYSGKGFWELIVKWRFVLLTLALGLYFYRFFEYNLRAPNYLLSIESCLWIFSVFAFGNKHLNKGGATLRYLSQAAYPVYILHMFFLYLAAWLLFPLDIPAGVKLVLSVLITGIGCMLTYEYVVRRIAILRPMFGLKAKQKRTVLKPRQETANSGMEVV